MKPSGVKFSISLTYDLTHLGRLNGEFLNTSTSAGMNIEKLCFKSVS